MRVRVYLFSVKLKWLEETIRSDRSSLIERTDQLLDVKGIVSKKKAETLDCIRESLVNAKKSKTGLPELLHAICWFLEANSQKTEIEAFQGWKLRFFKEFRITDLADSEVPDWLPVSIETAPSAFCLRHEGELKKAIQKLEESEWQNGYEDEFEEARDELVEVLHVIDAQNEDVVVISLLE
jgi:hypothetical protein